MEKEDFELRVPEFESQTAIELRLAEMNLRLPEKLIELEKHSVTYADLTKKDYKVRLSEQKIELENRKLSHADLLNLAGMLTLEAEENDLEIQAKNCHLQAKDLLVEYLNVCVKDLQRIIETSTKLRDLSDKYLNRAEEIEAAMEKFERKKKATKAADALHDLPGGSREKQENIRNIWASGKYTSRSICAEQECAGLGMSYDSARKALRNTPEPDIAAPTVRSQTAKT